MKRRLPSSSALEIDEMIRSGRSADAASRLSGIDISPVPRAERWAFAFLAWRCGKADLGVEWLNPIVHPKAVGSTEASPRTRAEYAACLIKLGALDEAEQLLCAIDSETVPEALVYSSFALAGRWDYARTIPLLERYLSQEPYDPYPALVARTNLAAALVFERRHREASELILRVSEEAQEGSHPPIRGIAAHLRAANLALEGDLGTARRFIDEVEARLGEAAGLDAFFVRKWRALVRFLESGEVLGLAEIRNEAIRRGSWETVRDCDRLEAVRTGNVALATHLLFGTPHEAFRRRLRADFPTPIVMPAEYRWDLGRGHGENAIALFGKNTVLKVGRLKHRLLATLCSDFYRPLTVGALFAMLFPGEIYHPHGSPSRVHETVRRTRSWLSVRKLPLAIEECAGGYHLAVTAPASLLLPSHIEGRAVKGGAGRLARHRLPQAA